MVSCTVIPSFIQVVFDFLGTAYTSPIKRTVRSFIELRIEKFFRCFFLFFVKDRRYVLLKDVETSSIYLDGEVYFSVQFFYFVGELVANINIYKLAEEET